MSLVDDGVAVDVNIDDAAAVDAAVDGADMVAVYAVDDADTAAVDAAVDAVDDAAVDLEHIPQGNTSPSSHFTPL